MQPGRIYFLVFVDVLPPLEAGNPLLKRELTDVFGNEKSSGLVLFRSTETRYE